MGTDCLWDQIIVWQNCSCLPGSQLSPGMDTCRREELLALRDSGVQGHRGLAAVTVLKVGKKRAHEVSCAAAYDNLSVL